MPCVRMRVVQSCHGCAYEWVDGCIVEDKHLPGDQVICNDCIRNPKPTVLPRKDRFISKEDVMRQLRRMLAEL